MKRRLKLAGGAPGSSRQTRRICLIRAGATERNIDRSDRFILRGPVNMRETIQVANLDQSAARRR